MEYSEGLHQMYQEEMCDRFTYYELVMDGAVYESGDYDTCVYTRDEMCKEYGKYGLCASDFRIESKTFTC